MKKLSTIIFAVAIINFIAFAIGTAVLDGDAVNGKSEGGRYYVANHGKLTEVSRAAFTYSRFHCYAVWITHPLAMIFGLLFYRQKQREKRTHDNPNVA
ncbi:MAG: hypothetical protein K8R23_03090 [Chthoniobacter sp.]|nr:hypothetical protein [Chthoniobacter sp.]